MANIKKEIPAIAGFMLSASLSVVTNGITSPAIMGGISNLIGNIAANQFGGFVSSLKRVWYQEHPDDINHDIYKLFVDSVSQSLSFASREYRKSGECLKEEKKTVRKTVNRVVKTFNEVNGAYSPAEITEESIRRFNEKDADASRINDMVLDSLYNELEEQGLPETFILQLRGKLPALIQSYFREGLKVNKRAQAAYHFLLMEDVARIKEAVLEIAEGNVRPRTDKKAVQGRNGYKIDPSKLQGLEEKLDNTLEVESAIQASLESVLAKLDKDNYDILKGIRELKRQNKIKIYAAIPSLAAAIFLGYLLGSDNPFAVTVKVAGWDQDFFPEQNGEVVLDIEGNTMRAFINKHGEAVFTNIPSKASKKQAVIGLVEHGGIPYRLADSLVYIKRGKACNVSAYIEGLDCLRGEITDPVNGDAIEGVVVMVAGLRAETDRMGYFELQIPEDKRAVQQEVEIFKEGYRKERFNTTMIGDNRLRLNLTRK